jgi:hypothetical protein
MQAIVLSRTSTMARLIIIILIAGVLLFTALWIRYPNLPKKILYQVFRSYERMLMDYKTRNWSQIKGKHFIIKFQSNDRDVSSLVLETSEEAYGKVNKKLNYSPEKRVPIILYPDTLSLNRSFGWAADESAMGVYWAGIIRILSPNSWIENNNKEVVFKSDGPMVHEYAHYVVDQIASGNYPRWLTEGIAQRVERSITGYKIILSGEQEIYPLAKMDRDFDLLPNQSAAYLQSLAMVDFLVNHYGGETALEDILHELGKGATLNGAFKKVIGINSAEFETAFIFDK